MKERLPALIALFLLIGLVITTWWAADYAQRAVPIDAPTTIRHEPDAWSGKFLMLTTNDKGQAINRLSGDRLRHFPDDDSYEADNAHLIGMHPNNPRTLANAKLAILKDQGDLVLLQGNAHIHRFPTEEHSRLDIHSEELTILPKEDIVKTDKEADVQQGNSRMKGKGMIYNNETRRLEVFANSDVKISPDDINKAKSK